MADYNSALTGKQIDERLAKVPQLEQVANQLSSDKLGKNDLSEWAKAATKPSYTASEVGADPSGTANVKVSQHNVATDSHNDIRLLISDINTRLNAFFDSDDATLDELSEIVAYIKSNKNLIDAVTTSKVSVADIVNNLTTNVANKPLSAAQGVVLKGLIDSLTTSLSNYQPKGDYALRSELPSVPVQSVNGKTGAVKLNASDVGARPNTWTPSASDVGARPSSWTPSAADITTALGYAPVKTSECINVTGIDKDGVRHEFIFYGYQETGGGSNEPT